MTGTLRGVIVGCGAFSYEIACDCGKCFQVLVPKSKKRFKPKCPDCREKTVSVMGNQPKMRIVP